MIGQLYIKGRALFGLQMDGCFVFPQVHIFSDGICTSINSTLYTDILVNLLNIALFVSIYVLLIGLFRPTKCMLLLLLIFSIPQRKLISKLHCLALFIWPFMPGLLIDLGWDWLATRFPVHLYCVMLSALFNSHCFYFVRIGFWKE